MKYNTTDDLLCLTENVNCTGIMVDKFPLYSPLDCFANCLYNLFCIYYIFTSDNCRLYALLDKCYEKYGVTKGDITCSIEYLKYERIYYNEIMFYFRTRIFIFLLVAQFFSALYVLYYGFKSNSLELHPTKTRVAEYISILVDLINGSIILHYYGTIMTYYDEDLLLVCLWSIFLVLIFLFRAYLIFLNYVKIRRDEINRLHIKMIVRHDSLIFFLTCIFGISLVKISLMGYENKKIVFLYSSMETFVDMILYVVTMIYLPFVFIFIRFFPLILSLISFVNYFLCYLLITFLDLYPPENDDNDTSTIDSFTTAVSL